MNWESLFEIPHHVWVLAVKVTAQIQEYGNWDYVTGLDMTMLSYGESNQLWTAVAALE